MKAVRIASTAILSLLIGIAPAYAQRESERQGKPEQQRAQPQQQERGQQQQHAQQQERGQQQHAQQQERGQQQHAQQQERGQQQHVQQQREQRGQQQQQHAQQKERGHQQERAQQERGHQQDRAQQQRGQQRQHAQRQEQGRQQAQQREDHTRHQQIRRTQEQRHSQEREQHQAWQGHRARHWESEHRDWRQRGGYNGYQVPDYYFNAHFGMGHPFHVYNLPFLVVGGYPRFQYEGYWFSAVDPYPEYWGDDWYQSDDVYVNYVDSGYYLFNRRYPGRSGVAISISF